MDIRLLAEALTTFLVPALPYLVELGGKAAEGAAKKLGADAWEKTRELWGRLQPVIEAKPGAPEILQDVAAAPDDAEARGALRYQLGKLLSDDADLAREIEQRLAAAGALNLYHAHLDGDGAIAQGPGSVASGAGGLAVGAVAGDLTVQAPRPPGETSEVALERDYLLRLMEDTGHLLLGGVDPAVMGPERETRLELQAVYTALLTEGRNEVEPDAPEREAKGRHGEGESRRLSALEQLDRHGRLVLLGDPGSGKSTFVNFVALCLAGERLGRPEANLERLTSPLALDGDLEEEPQPWSHGALLPVRVILRDFAARGLPPAGRRATAKVLWEFLAGELETAGLGDYAPHLRRRLHEDGGLLLLDGFDEVPEAEKRREQMRQAVGDFAASFPACRVLLTGRTYAYRKQEWALPGFEDAVLAPFTEGQIRRFVDGWYAHVGRLRKLSDAGGRAEALKRAIFGSKRLQALAERPLLLTLMASLHAWRGGSLPEKREELYSDAVDLLLDFWERQRLTHDAAGQAVLLEPSLGEYLKVDRSQVRRLLNSLAYAAHESQPELVGTADVPDGDLVTGLLALSRSGESRADAGELVEYLRNRAGLLMPRGVGVQTFPHRTFQEYLAACHLTNHEFPDHVAELARQDPDRWREVALLAGAKAARGSAATVWQLAEALCFREPEAAGRQPADEWGAHLAGQLLVESAALTTVSERHRSKIDRVRRWLVELLGSWELPSLERVAAGKVLARLGDPRFSAEYWYLPADPLLGFVEVPAGRFLMGSDTTEDLDAIFWELPQHELELPTYFIGRYLVTEGQFRVFVESSGYDPGERVNLSYESNKPVTGVNCQDAEAYCEWIGERLRELAALWLAAAKDEIARRVWGGLLRSEIGVGLPSEAEWEKAARGGDGRIYPWGDEPDLGRANCRDTRIGEASAVGCFPRGASECGCEDMSGNIWEWTRSLDGPYPYKSAQLRESTEAKKDVHPVFLTDIRRRVLRGGSWMNLEKDIRCAARDTFPSLTNHAGAGFRLVLSSFYAH